jgi:alpha-tubulin suppressor-like RCC1 family protein
VKIIFAVKEPVIVKQLRDKRIIGIACGDYHVLALTKDEKCFSFFSNKWTVSKFQTFLRTRIDRFFAPQRHIQLCFQSQKTFFIR